MNLQRQEREIAHAQNKAEETLSLSVERGVLDSTPPGLAPAQRAQLAALAKDLDRDQALWISGYFAGLSRSIGAPSMDDGPASSAVRVTILCGSESGNGTDLAENLAARLRGHGIGVDVFDMGDYKPRRLKDEQYVLAITSTHGEGDPPQTALDFFDFIEGRKAPKLTQLKFSVLALGDSTYEKYCEAGKRLDRRLEELGAVRLTPRVDCDVDFEAPAAEWMEAVRSRLPASDERNDAACAPLHLVTQTSTAAPIYDRRHPFVAPVIENLVLTGRGSSKETRHVEISLEGSGLTYEPGDALGIMPSNDSAVVDAILAATGLDGDVPVRSGDGTTPLSQVLASDFEIVTATPRFLEAWAAVSGTPALQDLTAPESAAERNAYLHGHHVIDILRAFPVPGIGADDLLSGLRPLQPRLYSIASSLSAVPDEVHLTIATVRYDLHGEPRNGVASGYIASHAAPDTRLPVYVQSNPHFRLPSDDVPIIMIGAGTGVAPYRAFMQEREMRGATGKSWLVFGERNFRTDFLYQTEWQEHLRTGLLTRMDVAFSRDRADKVYVQHKLTENGKELFVWLEEGAHLYVCGDAAHMAPDVHAALSTVLQDQGRLDPEAAEEYLRTLQRDHRYQRDVY